jgi:hypothetical protein
MQQFEGAIKATKEGKVFNYKELTVPPGFSQIPLRADGKPILDGSSGLSATSARPAAPARSPTAASSNRLSNISAASLSSSAKEAPKVTHDNDDGGGDDEDDILAQLSNELGDDVDDVELDDDDHQFNALFKHANSHISQISKLVPPLPKGICNYSLIDNTI